MASLEPSKADCPNCGAAYKVVRVEGASTREIVCKSCGGPLPAREGKFMLKYFLVKHPRERVRYGYRR
jgi:ssDNA-binding Zn-finger/Zn-ribbon topoisomerase 1